MPVDLFSSAGGTGDASLRRAPLRAWRIGPIGPAKGLGLAEAAEFEGGDSVKVRQKISVIPRRSLTILEWNDISHHLQHRRVVQNDNRVMHSKLMRTSRQLAVKPWMKRIPIWTPTGRDFVYLCIVSNVLNKTKHNTEQPASIETTTFGPLRPSPSAACVPSLTWRRVLFWRKIWHQFLTAFQFSHV